MGVPLGMLLWILTIIAFLGKLLSI